MTPLASTKRLLVEAYINEFEANILVETIRKCHNLSLGWSTDGAEKNGIMVY